MHASYDAVYSTYNVVVLGLVMELEGLPENNKEGIGSVDGKGCIYKRMICAITRRIITQAMVDEHQGSQLPQKTDEGKDAEMEEPQEGNGAVDHSDQEIPEANRLKHIWRDLVPVIRCFDLIFCTFWSTGQILVDGESNQQKVQNACQDDDKVLGPKLIRVSQKPTEHKYQSAHPVLYSFLLALSYIYTSQRN